jgi:hypothetical protein
MLQPVPAKYSIERYFLALQSDAIEANVHELLCRQAEFFGLEANRAAWAFVQDGDKYEQIDALDEIDNILTRLGLPGLHWWRLSLGRIDITPNMGLQKPFREMIKLFVDVAQQKVTFDAVVAGTKKAEDVFALLTQGLTFVDATEVERQRRAAPLASLASVLVQLEADPNLKPQTRGKKFEGWLRDLFDVYKLDATLDVQNSGEQIDFTFWIGSLFVVGEARWHTAAVDSPQVRDFFGKLRERPPFVVGLVISLSGLTQPALEYLGRHSGEHTVLAMDRPALNAVLGGQPELPEWLNTALRHRLEHPQG